VKASDAVLIAKVVATGSHDAFAKLVEAHQAPVRRFLLRMTQGDAMRTDDLAQETFIRAWQHIGDFHALSAFETWLIRIAYRCFIDDQRKMHQQSDSELHSLHLSSHSNSELSYDIDKAMATLSEVERTCITLQCIEGYSIRDIAKITEMNENTIKSHLSRGKHALAAFLKNNGY